MELNVDFAEQVSAQGIGRDQKILLICRSGQRSRSAAIDLTGSGFTECFNVADGFEGPHDPHDHRGRVTGWKVAGLPWVQS
jgi:rhodanese-related sulfurtransferase